jgi:cysteinyl-tRNA synthetase
MSPLQLHNTRTRAKQTFAPADPSGHAGLFVCGPTVYDTPHLGHAKTYTQFDAREDALAYAEASQERLMLFDHGPVGSPSGACSAGATRKLSRRDRVRKFVPSVLLDLRPRKGA